MARHEEIGAVTQPTGQYFEDFGEAPGTAQMACNFQSGVTFSENTFGTDEQHRVRMLRIQPMLSVQHTSGFGLDGAKVDDTLAVMLQYELDGPIAKIADAIKQQQVSGEFRGRWHLDGPL